VIICGVRGFDLNIISKYTNSANSYLFIFY
jgi:hypothetical protein